MKIFVDSVGCRLNQSEIEKMAAQFRAAGHILVDNPALAELVLVNTCTVTNEAAADSRQKVRQASRAGGAAIAVTGCWSTLDAAGAAALPGVRWVIPNERKQGLVAEVLNLSPEEMDLEPLSRQPLPGLHMRTRAFIKVQDGCDNHCTFCITRLARGAGRSQSEQDVLADINLALAGGSREIVLTGVHLGSWGQDFTPRRRLAELIQILLDQTNLSRLRLSSLEPWDLDEDFFRLWGDRRLCRHLHLPLQSGCAATLRRMARHTTPHSFAHLVELARAVDPEMAITTDIIVGFPGETDAEFAESLEYVKNIKFAAGHVFSYSPRPGTPAARHPRQVLPSVRKDRSRAMREAIAESGQRYREHFLGKRMEVLWEGTSAFGPDGWRLEGLTDNYLRVSALSPEKLWNEISLVELESLEGEGMTGKIIQ